MTEHPVCIDMNSRVSDVAGIMNGKGLHRIPVISSKKLVGLVTEDITSKRGVSKATSLSIYELNHLFPKISVNAITIHDVITIHEDYFLEDAALLMYKHDIGCLPVVSDANEVVGILTSNDVFPASPDTLGYRTSGSHACIEVEGESGTIGKISEIFTRNNCNITYLGVYSQHNGFADMIIHIDTLQTSVLASDLKVNGYKVLSITKDPNQHSGT